MKHGENIRCKSVVNLFDPRAGKKRSFNVRCRWRAGHVGAHRSCAGTQWCTSGEHVVSESLRIALVDRLLLSLPCAVVTLEELRARRAERVAERFIPSHDAELSADDPAFPWLSPIFVDEMTPVEPSVWDATVEAMAQHGARVDCVFAPTGELLPFEVRR